MDKITNKQNADNFVTYYYKNEAKHKAIMRDIAENFGFESEEYKAELEDELLITVSKCYNRIVEAGIKLGMQNGNRLNWDETYAAYFYRALKNNLMGYANKKSTQRARTLKYEKKVKQDSLYVSDPDEPEYQMEIMRKKEYLERITQEAVDSLPSKYQDVLYMLADGLTYKHMEKVLALSTGKVKMRIMTARKMVKQLVKEKMGDEFELGKG